MRNLCFPLLVLVLATAVASCSSGGASPGKGLIRIGAAVSETGKYAHGGRMTRQGYDLWVEYVNNDLGGIEVNGRKYAVEIIYYDDRSDPERAALLVEKLITEDKVDFILGPYTSLLTMPTSAVSEKYKVIMVEGQGAAESLFERGYTHLFAVLTPATFYTKAALERVYELGARTAVVAYEDTPFPSAVAGGAVKWAQELGMEVLAVESYPKGASDVSAIMARFKELNPDVFVGGGHFNDALLFVRQAKEMDFSPKAFIITVGPSSPKFVQMVGDDANCVWGPVQWDMTMSWEGGNFGTAMDYAQRFHDKYGVWPAYQQAEATAAALVLQLAIEKANSLETEAVREALASLDVMTFYGPVRFDETGKNIVKPMGAIQIQDGRPRIVAPANIAVAEPIYPCPGWGKR